MDESVIQLIPDYSLNSQKLIIIGGFFCISLDFEKFWGIHDVKEWKNELEKLKKVEHIVFDLLHLFEENEIHATWATVGLLACENEGDMLRATQNMAINYSINKFSPFPINQDKLKGIPFEIISGKKEIDRILSSQFQDLASHTYSHFYTMEEGQTIEEFKKDLHAMKNISKDLNHSFKSIVFPRNQINEGYLKECFSNGYTVFRGNQNNKLWSNSSFEGETMSKKVRRYLDAYYNIASTKPTVIDDLEKINGLINIPGSRFLRPASNNSIFEKKKIKRIKGEMKLAAVNKYIYHLWWHPHNFTTRTEQNFNQLKELLSYFKELKEEYDFASLNMSEIGEYASK